MKPELVIKARAERRFTFDSFAEVARAREALKAELLKLQNALTTLDYIESDLLPATGAC
jgi:hypothetical protein